MNTKPCPLCRLEQGHGDGCRVGRLEAELSRVKLAAMTQNGQCANEHIWPGHPEHHKLTKRIADLGAELAKRDQRIADLESALALAEVKHD